MALSIVLNGNSSLEVNVLRALELGQERLQSNCAAPTLLIMVERAGYEVFHDISSLQLRLRAEGCKNKSDLFN